MEEQLKKERKTERKKERKGGEIVIKYWVGKKSQVRRNNLMLGRDRIEAKLALAPTPQSSAYKGCILHHSNNLGYISWLDKLNILLSLMGHLACSQVCNAIQTHNKQRLEKHTILSKMKQWKEAGDRMTRVEGWSLRWRVYLSQLSRFTTSRINKNFNLFDLTCSCLKEQPGLLTQ